MERKSDKKWIGILLLAAWMIVIFLFSGQPGTESGQVSDGICYKLVSAVNSIFGLGWEAPQLEEYTAWIHLPVRKLAHMTEYGILAVLLSWNIGKLNDNRNRLQRHFYAHRNLFALLFAVCYAVTDEFHQTFIPGRSGNGWDVCVDGAGAMIGLGIMLLIKRIRSSYRYSND